MRGLDATEVEEDEEIPNLTPGTESEGEIEGYEADDSRSVGWNSSGTLVVTRKFETSTTRMEPPSLELSSDEEEEFEFVNLNELAKSLPGSGNTRSSAGLDNTKVLEGFTVEKLCNTNARSHETSASIGNRLEGFPADNTSVKSLDVLEGFTVEKICNTSTKSHETSASIVNKFEGFSAANTSVKSHETSASFDKMLEGFSTEEDWNTTGQGDESTSSIKSMINIRPSKVNRRTVGDFGAIETSALEDYDFETLGNTTDPSGIIGFVNDACSSIETMVSASPAKAGEIDGVEILGYMDGIRVVKRLKKKLEDEVEYSYQEQVVGQDGACACKSLDAQVDSSLGIEKKGPRQS